MTLATKNGSLILTDGKLAENCECCGDWYCCPDAQCFSTPSAVSVMITADDEYAQYSMRAFSNGFYDFQSSTLFPGAHLAGTHALTQTTTLPTLGRWSSTWTKEFQSPQGCRPTVVEVSLSQPSSVGSTFMSILLRMNLNHLFYASPTQVKQPQQMSCSLPSFDSSQQPLHSREGFYLLSLPIVYLLGIPACPGNPASATFTYVVEPSIGYTGILSGNGSLAFDNTSWLQPGIDITGIPSRLQVPAITAINTRTGRNLLSITVSVGA